MQRKIREYFEAGARLVWLVDPPARTARVYTSPSDETFLSEEQDLEGGEVLPGFRLCLQDWLNRAPLADE